MNNLEEKFENLVEELYNIRARLDSSASTFDVILLMLDDFPVTDTNLQKCGKISDVVRVLREYVTETAERCDVMDNGLNEIINRFTPEFLELLKIYYEELSGINQARVLVYADKLREEASSD